MSAAHSFDTNALARYLEQHVAGFRGPLSAEKFAGGQSNPTFLITSSSGKYVLRRKPPGTLLKSAHAVDREFRVITALQGSDVPVAKGYHLCTDDDIIGSMFYVMEFVEGEIYWDPSLPDLSNDQRTAMYNEMARVLAALHSVDVDAVGLSDFGKPGNYFERQIKRWTDQYRASETDTVEPMEALIAWLPANMPEDDGRVSLVHGDYRLDNMIFNPKTQKVLALVDWELSTLGHPYADLSYQWMQLRMGRSALTKGLAGLDVAALGIPTEEEYVADYCRLMGLDGIPNWNFYLIFSYFRLAAIVQGVKKRALDGNASSEKAAQMGALVGPIAGMATALL